MATCDVKFNEVIKYKKSKYINTKIYKFIEEVVEIIRLE